MHVRPNILAVLAMLSGLVFANTPAGQQDPVVSPRFVPPPLTSLPPSVVDAKLSALRGPSFSLSEYSGKILVINLWASWVGPSHAETPELEKLHKQYSSRGVVVVGLSTENPRDSRAAVRRWVRRYGLHYKIGWASPEVAITLMQGRDAIPQTFVVSRTGRIVKRVVGFNPTSTAPIVKLAIDEALNEPPVSETPQHIGLWRNSY